ncbi:MAG: M48 family metallopeptidase [Succinivibrio sp.]|nr:M48 family metallopeptidase [Succinivibrio sp.]
MRIICPPRLKKLNQARPNSIKVSLKAAALTALLALSAPALSAESYQAPDIGTAGITGMTVQREKQVGEYFMRMARSHLAIADDPVLNEYLDTVGNKLVAHAHNVRFPFKFFIVKNAALNASAFLGGKIQVNTGLFHYADSEDEFASVLAHEISHVTQRHIARYIEAQSRSSSLTVAGMIGAVAMAIINPALGAAALSTTVGISAQSGINFTRENEAEADRIGIGLLYDAGFNPEGMCDMFRKLMSMQGKINAAYSMLIDHPLSEVRLAEAQERVAQLPKRHNSTNADFSFAKARIEVRYTEHRDLEELRQRFLNTKGLNKLYRNYGLALVCFEQKNYAQAREYLQALEGYRNNIFVLDLLTDIDLASHNGLMAVNRLQEALRSHPDNQVVVINLANACLETSQAARAVKVLNTYLGRHPDNTLALDLLAKASFKLKDRCNALQAQGQLSALYANYGRAVSSYNEALNSCPGAYSRDVLQARLVQLSEQRAFDEAIEKGLK